MNIDEYEKLSKDKLKKKSYADTITIDMLASSSMILPNEALKIETVFSCVRDKAESIGQLPVKLRRNREIVDSGREWRIFTQRPCDYITMQGFLEMMVINLELRGAFYAYKERNDRGNVMAVIPFRNQHNVHPAMDVNGNVYYTYTTNDGKIKDPYRIEDLVIVSMFTQDGYTPTSPIQYSQRLLQTSKAQDENYKELQENGITAQMALKTDGMFNDPSAIERLKSDWKAFRGPNGRKNIPVLEQGLTPISLKLSPADSDLISHREYSVDSICRIFRVPPERIGVSRQGSAPDLNEINEAYMRDSLNPILVKFEYAMNALLPDNLKIQVDRKAFYAGSPWRMVEAVEREVKGGLASINEGRVDLGRDPIDGGDVFAIDNNNVVYGTWPELPAIQRQIYGSSNNEN